MLKANNRIKSKGHLKFVSKYKCALDEFADFECNGVIQSHHLLKPYDGQSISYVHVFFEWDQESDAIMYNIQLSASSSFTNNLLDMNTSKLIHIYKDDINWNDTYYWRVRSIYDNEDLGYGDWIDQSSFSTGGTSFQNINVNIYDGDLLEDGYVAISGFAPELASIIIDKQGNEMMGILNSC